MKRANRMRSERGTAMLTVLGVVVLVGLIGAIVLALARQQVFSTQKAGNYLKAKAIAEAGANAAYNLMKTNFAAADNAANFPPTSFGGGDGAYDATVTKVGASNALISSVGTYGGAVATVKLDVQNNPRPTTNAPPPLTSPWAYTLFANGYMRFNGSSTVRGAMHVNNYIDCNGSITWGWPTQAVYVECCDSTNGFKVSGIATVYGTVRAPKIEATGGKAITTEIVEQVPRINLPDISQTLNQYYAIAVSNAQVYSSQSINNDVNWGYIPGGVRWINGTLTVKGGGSITYTGVVVATGNIQLKGGCRQTSVGSMPALISRDGAIEISGSHRMYGLVYAKGDMTYNGSGTLNGSLIAGGNVLFNGSASLDATYAYCDPDASMTTAKVDRVIVTAWQE